MEKQYGSILRFGGRAVFGQEVQPSEAAVNALDRLTTRNRDYPTHVHNPAFLTKERRMETVTSGQHPYALVLCCADSRVPPEHIFEAGLGELFVLRNAGNLVSETVIASAEYAVEHLNTQLVVVMGHTHCGAVGSALAHAKEPGALGHILAVITEAIGDITEPRLAEKENLMRSMRQLGSSELLKEQYLAGKVAFAAAVYDIETGNVEFLQD